MLADFLATGTDQVFFGWAWALTNERLLAAAGVTLAFALLARAVRGVTFGGALAGGAVCFALFAGLGPVAFAVLAALFALTWLSTRAGYRRKLDLGVAERREGRGAWQVFANLAVAGVCSLAFAGTGNRAWVVATIAALAEAATDTVASEIGQSKHREARLVTTWERVRAGTDGGVTATGTASGALAGLGIVAVAALGGLLPQEKAWIPAVAGFSGMIFDSVLGATIQRRGWASNQSVNLLATFSSAVLAYGLAG
jgi:uncharacterized protein (TIGR00297 family)